MRKHLLFTDSRGFLCLPLCLAYAGIAAGTVLPVTAGAPRAAMKRITSRSGLAGNVPVTTISGSARLRAGRAITWI
jgi:hypothetical protein